MNHDKQLFNVFIRKCSGQKKFVQDFDQGSKTVFEIQIKDLILRADVLHKQVFIASTNGIPIV